MKIAITIILILMLIDIVTVDLIARYSCDRKCPKLPDFLSQGLIGKKGKKNSSNRVSKSRERAKALKEAANQRFEITSSDGLKMVAHYYPKENAKRLIIAVHGWRSSWDYDFNGQYEFLHNNDCSILFTESRAHGESEGRYMYYGKIERFDLLQWIKFARENITADLPIYIYGMSAGASTAIMTSCEIKDRNILGIIADSPSTSARDSGKMTIKNIHLSPLIFYTQVRFDCLLRLGMDDNAFTPLDALKTSQIPLLILHGSNDRLAPPFMAQELYNTCNADKQIVEFKNAGHMKSFYTNPLKYEKTLLDFFQRQEAKQNSIKAIKK